MTPSDADLHLRVALEANAAAYRRTVQTSTPGECWDILVLTAANEKQAEGYRSELELRHRAAGPAGALFPAIQKSIVVADPPARRLGSGGATLAAVRAVAGGVLSLEELAQRRVLVVHSGGASQRLPAYSAQGKIFSPLPLLRPDGQISTLFDHLYVALAGLPERFGPGMLVVAGDVFLLFDHRHVRRPLPGVTALTWRVQPELALGHGVYVLQGEHAIRGTLQKAPVEVLRDSGAMDEHGRVLIDTGLLFFDAERVKLLGKLAGVQNEKPYHERLARGSLPARAGRPCHHAGLHQTFAGQIDLYSDITAALASGTERSAYLAGDARRLREKLWDALHGTPFQAMVLEGEFLHLGTTRQFRDALVGRDSAAAAGLFQQDLLKHGSWPEAARPAEPRAHRPPARIAPRIYHSVLLPVSRLVQPRRSTEIGAGSVIDHSILAASSRIGAGSVVSQVFSARPIMLGAGLLFFQVPIAASGPLTLPSPQRGRGKGEGGPRRYAQVLCGIEDDFKGCYGDGKCSFLNRPIDLWLARRGLKADSIWPGVKPEARTLWNALLFPATVSRDEAAAGLWLAAAKPASRRVAAWRRSARYSMAMILEQVDPKALIEHRETVSAYLQAGALLNAIRSDQPLTVDSVVGHFTSLAAYEAAERLLLGSSAARSAGSRRGPAGRTPSLAARAKDRECSVRELLCQARATWCAALLRQRPAHPAAANGRAVEPLMERAFAAVAEAAEAGYGLVGDTARTLVQTRLRKLDPGCEIVATSPVRLDLGGGWSDTPPYCFERGGHVVNVAIDLNGRPPVSVRVQTTPELELLVDSQDLGQRVALSKSRFERGRTAIDDPFSLHTVALDMCGLLPRNHAEVVPFCRQLGAGLRISTECRVPKGSGLGTSSILAATLLAALHALCGERLSRERLLEETLVLEQRLSTGGGWQDQAGGICGGVKSTTTAPGIPQRPKVETLALSQGILDGLEQRLVVYYSGQQRLARDILRRVLGRWLAREPAVLFLMDELKESAAKLRQALLRGKWAPAGHEISRYWRIKKELYPGSTTPAVDVLFAQLRGQYLAAGLAGAGGGGFAYFLCKDPARAACLRKLLAAQAAQPGNLGSVFETQINRQGLRLTQRVLTPIPGRLEIGCLSPRAPNGDH